MKIIGVTMRRFIFTTKLLLFLCFTQNFLLAMSTIQTSLSNLLGNNETGLKGVQNKLTLLHQKTNELKTQINLQAKIKEAALVPTILMVGADPDEDSVLNYRKNLLDPTACKVFFLNNEFVKTSPTKSNCFTINFNNDLSFNSIYLGLLSAKIKKFDFIVIDWSVTKFMEICVLEKLIKLLKPTGSLFIQGFALSRQGLFISCATIQDFEKKYELLFLKLFSESSILNVIPFYRLPKDNSSEEKVREEEEEKNIRLVLYQCLKKHFKELQSNSCTCEIITNLQSLPPIIRNTLHKEFVNQPLYKITRIDQDSLDSDEE